MNTSFLDNVLAENGIEFSNNKFVYRWDGELAADAQIRALAQASGFNAQWNAPIMVVDGANVMGRWYVPSAGELTVGQARAAVDTLGKGVLAMREVLGESIGEFSVDWEADAPRVTYGRIEDWFAQRGVAELPQDNETGALCLSMDGTPVDIHIGDVFSVQVSAHIPDGDPAQVLHLCNLLNKSDGPAVCGVLNGEQWWAIARYTVEARAGLSDAQLDAAIREGVTGAGAKVRDLLRARRG
ncbi:YbjN domain-containing protein [Corynebacterium freiburgense]|uniref:YbjN domain-containing protein n=1 Tax=Corynebacterium freiburgense TaxID=556548 RepID=UPI0012EC4465|nr:YbjN domain-containing protein [Corynebacterium freiburgense]